MAVDVSVIDVRDRAWDSLLRRVPHDVYHERGYASTFAKHEGARAAMLHARSASGKYELCMPLLVKGFDLSSRRRPGVTTRIRDAASPYGYACPVTSFGCPAPEALGLLQAAFDRLRDDGIVSVFLRSHPLMGVPSSIFRELGHTVVDHGTTVLVEAQRESAEQWQRLRRRFRPEINGLVRDGYRVKRAEADALETFHDLYTRHMARIDAAEGYFFSLENLRDLYASCRRFVELYEVRGPSGEVACSGMFFAHGSLGSYHLSATRVDHVERSPIKLLLWHVIRDMAERGLTYLHLGGGVGGNDDSLHRFKLGFSKVTRPFFTARCVLDEASYALACEGTGNDGRASRAGFFPRYRQESELVSRAT